MAPKSSVTTVNMGTWSAAEDVRLKEAVAKYGTRWASVAGEVGTRNGDQCAKRWNSNLNPELDHSRWTPEEDQLLLQLVESYGREWKFMADSFLEARAPLAIKNRYSLLMRRFKRSLKQSRGSTSEGDVTRPTSRMDSASDDMTGLWCTSTGGTSTPIEDATHFHPSLTADLETTSRDSNHLLSSESRDHFAATTCLPHYQLPASDDTWQSILAGLDTSFNIAGATEAQTRLDGASISDCTASSPIMAQLPHTIDGAMDDRTSSSSSSSKTAAAAAAAASSRRGGGSTTTATRATKRENSPLCIIATTTAAAAPTTAIGTAAMMTGGGFFEDGGCYYAIDESGPSTSTTSSSSSTSTSSSSYADGAVEYTVTCPRADVKKLASHLLDAAVARRLPEGDMVMLTLRLQKSL